MIPLDDALERADAPADLEAQLRVARQHDGVADVLLVATGFRCESPAGDLWRRRGELGAPLLPRHQAIDAARRIADEEPGLRGFLRYLDANEEAQVLGRGWVWRHVLATGRREYLRPGTSAWVGLRRAAAACRAEVLGEERAGLGEARVDGPRVVREGYDQRRQGDEEERGAPSLPDWIERPPGFEAVEGAWPVVRGGAPGVSIHAEDVARDDDGGMPG